MFLSTYEKLRERLSNITVVNMAHLGPRAFDEISGEVVQSTSFVFCNTALEEYRGTFCRLLDGSCESEKERLFYQGNNRYYATQREFKKIPGAPYSYWLTNKMRDVFSMGTALSELARPRQGMATTNNDMFLRLWFENAFDNIGFHYSNLEDTEDGCHRWFPYNKGGSFRKWYGNNDYVVNWHNNGEELKEYTKDAPGGRMNNMDCYFKRNFTWSALAMGQFSARYCERGFIFDTKGSACFLEDDYLLKYYLAFANSCIAMKLLTVMAPTLDFNSGVIGKLPIIFDKGKAPTVNSKVSECIQLSKSDWDSFETSWDFERHPLVKKGLSRYHWNAENTTIDECFRTWSDECNQRFGQLKANEEDLNRIFIEVYGLQDELTPEVEDRDVTVRRADLQRDIKSLLSYAVGCMFGRYSLGPTGLTYAGGEWDERKYSQFKPDADNVIPISDEEYLEDDIVSRLCLFLKVVFGEGTLEENIDYIAKALGKKGDSSREIIRNYFLDDFFRDHCQTYSSSGSGKRPIYWLFDSGKQNGFKALIYLHRYNADTIGNLRIDYLHRMQRIYESEISRMQDMIDHSTSGREVAQATKRREKLTKQLKECREYDEKLAHLALSRIELSLDDGVKKNYRKIQTASDGKLYEVLADSKNIMSKE